MKTFLDYLNDVATKQDSPAFPEAKKGAVNRESQPPTPTWVGSLDEELASERFLEAEEGE